MKDLAQHSLTEDERKQVENAVKAAEKRTAGEIVVMIISSSYQYLYWFRVYVLDSHFSQHPSH